MPNIFPSRVLLVLMAGAFSVVSGACSIEGDRAESSSTASSQAASSTATIATTPLVEPVPAASPTPEASPAVDPLSLLDPYELALDKASSASSIGASAQSADDWKLVVSQWQQAIALLKKVSNSSPYQPLAKDKLSEYQQQLAYAQKQAAKSRSTPNSSSDGVIVLAPEPAAKPVGASQATAPTKPPQAAPGNKRVFQVPIKRRAGGTPVIDVVFNRSQTFEMIVDTGASGTVITQAMANSLGVKPVTTTIVNTASAKGLEIPVGFVDTIEVGGAGIRDVAVAIAGPELDIGLLGHDFFGNYDVTVKRDVVEFRVR